MVDPSSQYDGIVDTTSIPVIDMSRICSDSNSDESHVVANEIVSAFQTIGFVTLINHGIASSIIDKALEQSRCFFTLDENTKVKYKFQGYDSNRGYIGMGCEKHDNMMKADRKETFDIGNEDEDGYDNHWPSDELSDTFRTTMLQYFDAFDALQLRIMRLLAIGLKLQDENYFVHRCNGRHENMRLLHYPSIPKPQQGDDKDNNNSSSNDDESSVVVVRGAVHTDFGTLTLLTQDDVGGLRAQMLNGTWVAIPPVRDSIVVNVGDMLSRWSNDMLRATPHQVVHYCNSNDLSQSQQQQQDHEENENINDGTRKDDDDDDEMITMIPERYSIAFFCNANKDVTLKCLDQCCTPEGSTSAKYPPINAHDYLVQRLSETISKKASL